MKQTATAPLALPQSPMWNQMWSPERLLGRPLTLWPMAMAEASLTWLNGALTSLGGAAPTASTELQHKLAATQAFRHAEILAGSLDSRLGGAARLRHRLRAVATYRETLRPWLWEGLGWAYANRTCNGQTGPHTLPPLDGVPPGVQLAVHAGYGMASAHRLLQTAGSDGLAHTLNAFRHLCRRRTRPGYSQASFEPLGLIVGLSFPEHLMDVHRQLDADEVSFFWHGVGRGTYFAPSNGVAGEASLGRALGLAQQAPNATARANRLSGLAWAHSLVNQVHPEFVEQALRQVLQAPELKADDRRAWSDGVASATVLWCSMQGRRQAADALWIHQPCGLNHDLWHEAVRGPLRHAFEVRWPHCAVHNHYEEWFRYGT